MLHDCWNLFRETGDPLCYLIGRRLESCADPGPVHPPERITGRELCRPERECGPVSSGRRV